MKTINIYPLGSVLADNSLLKEAEKILQEKTDQTIIKIDITNNIKEAEIVMLYSGGTEKEYISLIKKYPHLLPLIIASPYANAYAAAKEIEAWGYNNNIKITVISLNAEDKTNITQKLLLSKKVSEIKKSSLGLIGKPSYWLIASVPQYDKIKEKLNITLKQYDWEEVLSYTPNENHTKEFKEYIKMLTPNGKTDIDDQTIDKTINLCAKIYSFILNKKLDFTAIECFSLLQKEGTTGCLALAILTEKGIISACEGDICSALGMFFAYKITDQIPWMANTIYEKGSKLRLAHCTIAPTLIKSPSLTSHFESQKGVAIAGVWEENQDITILRISDTLKEAYITTAITKKTNYSLMQCRTQLECELKKTLPPQTANHKVLIKGDYEKTLKEGLELLGIEIKNGGEGGI